jgi:hypothetical protein
VSLRIEEELVLLRAWFGERLEYAPAGHWVKISSYCLPKELWSPAEVEVAFQIPELIPGQAPYSFHVRPGVVLVATGRAPDNYTYPTSNPWGDGWGTFSWQLEPWQPGARASDGSNVLDFARSIAERFRQGA